MRTDDMLRELNYVLNQEQGKTYGTCSTNWRHLLEAVIDKIKEQDEIIRDLRSKVED